MDFIEKIFKKTGWISILVSLVFAVLGAILVWKPEETIKVISYTLGVIFIVVIYRVLAVRHAINHPPARLIDCINTIIILRKQ